MTITVVGAASSFVEACWIHLDESGLSTKLLWSQNDRESPDIDFVSRLMGGDILWVQSRLCPRITFITISQNQRNEETTVECVKNRGQFVFFPKQMSRGVFFQKYWKKKLVKLQTSTTHSTFWCLFYLSIILAYIVRAFTRTITPPPSAMKQGIWRHEPRENPAAQPTILALDCLLYTSPSPRD